LWSSASVDLQFSPDFELTKKHQSKAKKNLTFAEKQDKLIDMCFSSKNPDDKEGGPKGMMRMINGAS
jgi:hypothetical protein